MIKMGNAYKTRDGREVRIYATDGGSDYPVHGAVKDTRGMWEAEEWTADGGMSLFEEKGGDLVEVKPRIHRECWLNVYRDGIFDHASREDADYSAGNRIACVKITIDCEEGEGL